MFGRQSSAFPLIDQSLKVLMDEFLGIKEEVDLTDAVQLDTYPYTVNGILYVQKVYRLKDHTIYVETTATEATTDDLKAQLEEAVKNQRFEEAAVLRDRIKLRK